MAAAMSIAVSSGVARARSAWRVASDLGALVTRGRQLVLGAGARDLGAALPGQVAEEAGEGEAAAAADDGDRQLGGELGAVPAYRRQLETLVEDAAHPAGQEAPHPSLVPRAKALRHDERAEPRVRPPPRRSSRRSARPGDSRRRRGPGRP